MLHGETRDNQILAGLPRGEQDILLPACEMIEVNLGDILDEAGMPVAFVHFPLIAAISVTAMEDPAHMIEVTLTGKEGASGSSVVDGDDRSMCTTMVQIPGRAIRVPTSVVMSRLAQLPYLNAALSRHNLLLMRNAVISVSCSRFHSPPQRLARWLKAHWHRTGIDSFPFSAQFLSAQVGVEPNIVAGALDEFQQRGILKVTHKSVTITNQEALGQRACPCYELAKKAMEEYESKLAGIARSHRDS
jgi:hypothetical protein